MTSHTAVAAALVPCWAKKVNSTSHFSPAGTTPLVGKMSKTWSLDLLPSFSLSRSHQLKVASTLEWLVTTTCSLARVSFRMHPKSTLPMLNPKFG